MVRFCSSAGEGTGDLLHVKHSTCHGCSIAFVLVNLLVKGSSIGHARLDQHHQHPVRASSIRLASEHASLVNLDAEYGPVLGSVNQPRVPPAQGVPRQPPRAVVRRHSQKIFLITTPYSRARRPAWTALTDARATARI